MKDKAEQLQEDRTIIQDNNKNRLFVTTQIIYFNIKWVILMKKTISIILLIILLLVMLIPNYIYATDNTIQTENYKDIYTNKRNTEVVKAGGKALAIAQVIGVSCGVILLLILGIKYMMMSYDAGEKASIKEKLIPYVIGAVLLFGGSGILGIIANFSQKMDKNTPAQSSSQQSTSWATCPYCGNYGPAVGVCQRCNKRF